MLTGACDVDVDVVREASNVEPRKETEIGVTHCTKVESGPVIAVTAGENTKYILGTVGKSPGIPGCSGTNATVRV